MATRTLAYECMYCGALKRSKNICERHEKTCLSNPESKNCVRCKNSGSSSKGLMCKVTHKRCSVAVSADCEHFVRREANE